jgi:aryl-alcohol dehydrogenase-like predicted oxidoreductase
MTINSLEEIATKKGVSMAQIALAWSMAQDVVTAPIVGTTSLNNLLDLLGELDWMQTRHIHGAD